MSNDIEKKNANRREKTVVLILTHSCNLSCIYCYEHHKGQCCINIEEAKKIISNEMNLDDDYDRVFEFFGGEPFLEFEKIVELHDFLSSKKWRKKWSTIITTNGTLVHGKIINWLLEHKKTVQVALSIDGTPYMHNTNRSNSYDLIDFDFFAKTYSIAKMTVSSKTLPYLSEGIIHIHNLGFKVVTANLAFGVDWSNDNNLSIFATELHKLADFYIDNPKISPSNIMDLNIKDIDPNSRSSATRYCGAGVEMVAYEIDGTSYPCHTFAPISVGEDIAHKSLKLTFEKEINLNYLDEKCRNCIVANVCPNCYGINFSTTGNMYSKDDSFCKMIQVQFVANAYFKYRQYLTKTLHLSPKEEYRLLNNIKLVQNLGI